MWCTQLAGNAGPKKSPSAHQCTTLAGYIFATKARINSQKKNLLNSNTSSTCLRTMVKFGNGWDRFGSLGHPCKFKWVSRLGSVTARHSRNGRQPNFATLNRGRHLYWAERPSRWALAHISSSIFFFFFFLSLSNLSRRRLDVYHTSTHGVALVRI